MSDQNETRPAEKLVADEEKIKIVSRMIEDGLWIDRLSSEDIARQIYDRFASVPAFPTEKKLRFKVTDNHGRDHVVDYNWNKDDGIPNEETILEKMEECDCSLNESVNHCEGDCFKFDNGKVELIVSVPVVPEVEERLINALRKVRDAINLRVRTVEDMDKLLKINLPMIEDAIAAFDKAGKEVNDGRN